MQFYDKLKSIGYICFIEIWR